MVDQTGIRSKRVIVVDHDDATSQLIAEILEYEGFAPLCCSSGLLSVENIKQAQANLLILELGLGDPSAALDLLGELRRNVHTLALPVIVNSTDDRLLKRLAEPLRDLGCVALAKPFELDDFFLSISLCLAPGRSQTQRLAC